MATHASILAWETPGMRSLVGSQRIAYDLSTKQRCCLSLLGKILEEGAGWGDWF